MLRAFKILVSVGLLTYLLSSVDWSSAVAAFRNAHVGALCFAILIIFGQAVISAWKWRVSLEIHQLQWRTSRLLNIIFVGYLFNNLLPTAVGGDLYRIYRTLPRNGERKSRAISALLLDRIVGLSCLLVVGAVGACVLYARDGNVTMGILAALLALPPASACALLPLLRLPALRPLLVRAAQAPKLEPLVHNVRFIVGDKRGLLKLVGVSMLFQVLAVVAIVFFFAALQIFDVFAEAAVVSTMYSISS
ncbi:MAG TPA: lysylphosphatidylglycerol synthase transmembrane domain-containing protein, partial [Gammaproteobacteria bacterium]|nr:lysylphosphatidylglycerol synthase transmembrane domain-containing protein [Gammaproteobacteria bacterium]